VGGAQFSSRRDQNFNTNAEVQSISGLVAVDITISSNHAIGMKETVNKCPLGRLLNFMRELFPSDFKFFPRTWYVTAANSAFFYSSAGCCRKSARMR